VSFHPGVLIWIACGWTLLQVAILLLCWVLGTNGTAHSGYWANIIDIAGEGRSADLLGISNTIATVSCVGVYTLYLEV
jgi:hypothetical protein